MKKTRIAALALFFLAAAALAFGRAAMAEDPRPMKFIHGVVSGYEGQAMLVNEGWRVLRTKDTVVYTAAGKELKGVTIKARQWLYLEGFVNADGSVEAEKIYLLPRHIKGKERKKYPFMNLP